jgi:hypothetical protein
MGFAAIRINRKELPHKAAKTNKLSRLAMLKLPIK